MTSPARVFSPLRAQPPAEVIAKIARGARVTAEPAQGTWRSLRLSGGVLGELRLVDASLETPEILVPRIRALTKRIVDATPRGPTQATFRARRLLGRSRHVTEIEGFRIEDDEHQGFVLDLARLVYGLVEVGPGILDGDGRWVLDRQGGSTPGAGARPMLEALDRRARSIAALAKLGVVVPQGLMLVESEEEVFFRPPADLKRRALALWRTYRETCGAPELAVERDELVRTAVDADRTAKEKAAVASGDRTLPAWGVEAIWALLYVLDAIPALGTMGAPCQADAAMAALDALTRQGSLDDGAFRPVSEILDALDLHQCLAWALAERGGLPAPMNGGVVGWRLRALRWAVADELAPWDRVTTDA